MKFVCVNAKDGEKMVNHSLMISKDGLTVTSQATGNLVALASFEMHPNSGKYYWEVEVLHDHESDNVMIGVSKRFSKLSCFLGVDDNSWAIFCAGLPIGEKPIRATKVESFTKGDVIGVLYDSDKKTLGFSKNGKFFGTSFGPDSIPKDAILYPAVSMLYKGDSVRLRPCGGLRKFL